VRSVCPVPDMCVTVSRDNASAGKGIKMSITGKSGSYSAIGWGGDGMVNTDYAVSK
jgi:hypothetical protein